MLTLTSETAGWFICSAQTPTRVSATVYTSLYMLPLLLLCYRA